MRHRPSRRLDAPIASAAASDRRLTQADADGRFRRLPPDVRRRDCPTPRRIRSRAPRPRTSAAGSLEGSWRFAQAEAS